MTHDISRKVFLRGAIGTAAAGALFWPALDAAVPKARGGSGLQTPVDEHAVSPSNGYQDTRLDALGNPEIPAGVKIRGANHVLKFEHSGPQDLNDAWAALWRVWDWSGWVQPQLDDIAKVGNAVRFWGNTLVLALGNLSLSQYLAQWKQALDYIDTLGLLVYPCGGDLAHWGGYTVDESIKCYHELASLLATYNNVIGMDIVNEAALFPWYQSAPSARLYQQPQPYDQFVQQLGASVRAQKIPVAYSRSLSAADQWTLESPLDAAGDFLDFHVYYTPSSTDSLGIYETSWGAGKKMLIGEFGMNETESSDTRRECYTAIRNMTVNDPNCMGALAWAAYDPAKTPAWEFGLFDRRRVLRDDIGEPFSTFPVMAL
jgi:hypothetical protein